MLVLAIFIFGAASVCASDVNDTVIASEDTSQLELSAGSELDADNLKTSEKNTILTQTTTDESMSREIDSEVLGADMGTYSGLSEEIGSGGNIELIHDYYTYDSGSTIEISDDNSVIDGKGAVIDMAGSNKQAFDVSASGVIIKNLTIKNAKYNALGGAILFGRSGTVENCIFTNNSGTSSGGAVYFSNTGTVTNCTFVGNTASVDGGAVYFSNTGIVTNCNFINNKATGTAGEMGSSGDGGAVHFTGDGTVTNCNFTGNTATGDDGGAVHFTGDGTVSNCTFVGNTAGRSGGGAVYFSDTGIVTNCNFTNNKATGGSIYGGAIWIYSGTVTNCSFTNHSANYGGAVRMGSGSVENCNFTDNTATRDGGAIWIYSGTVTNCNFTNSSATGAGGAVYFYDNSEVTNCNFIYNVAKSSTLGGGAIFFMISGNVAKCNFTDNSASFGGAVLFGGKGNISNSNFTNNSASNGGGAINMASGSVENCNFTDNKATSSSGGSIWFTGNGDVINCIFTNNSATGDGGAVYFYEGATGRIINCNFTDNIATSYGGAVYFNETSTVSNCNFTGNNANGDGGAIYFLDQGTVSNCNFADNTATYGGAVYFLDTGNVTNCNFTNNTATSQGGAIRFRGSGTVTNCNFTNNTASRDGGAVYFWGQGNVTNCNFTGNTADNGGAVYFYQGTGSVTNCNFADNTATYGGAVDFLGQGTVSNCNFADNTAPYGGAVFFLDTGNVTNCNFTNNTATFVGGAIRFRGSGTVTNCNFTNNTATSQGGAIRFDSTGTVSNCNFTGNNATAGSAIYFHSTSANKTVSNSRFLNNRANAKALEITKNDNNITITFTGRNNLLNAIYSSNDAEVTFTNVTYWGAKGITTVSATMSGSNKATGQNITVGVVVNNELVLSDVMVTDENGMIVLDISAGENYYISARHDTDSYYTEAEKTITNNTKFNVNVTSQTTTNKTVNITAKSNIYSEVMPGKLLFILPNGTQINATYGTNGTWWAEHTFDAYGEYKVNATYVGLDNVTINNGTITINKVNSTITLDNIVLDYGETKNVTVITTGATGITAKIDGNDVTVINNYTIQIPVLDAGTYNLTVTTIPDDDHNPVTKEVNITVNKVNSTLTLDDVVLDYGESKNITVTTEGATCITAKIDGVNVTVSNYTIPISGLGAGNYTLTVTTIADKNHNPVTKEVNITVNKLSTEIILANETLDLKVGDEVPVLANLTPAGAGSLTFTSSNEDLVFVEDNVTIVANSQGQAIITVSFAGNENYTAAENKTITVNVELNDASVSVENATLNLKVDETCAINATIEPDTIMLKIKYTSSNESVATVDKNGIVTAVGEGRAIITLEVGDDEIYAKNSTTVTVTVSKINTTADVSIPENITVGDNSTVNVILPADAKGNVTVKVDGEVVDTVPVKDGNADVTIPSMSAGNHTVEIAYSGDGKYNPINETKEISVSKNDITPEITIPSDIEFGDNATVDIKIPGDATGNVTLTVDGKVVGTVPVTDGTASVKLPALDAGNHTAEIDYSGDDKYKSASKTTTIGIGKDSTNISAADVTATYKVDKYLVITLKDSKGNPLANATVTVDLNTIKNYSTDENGQIKIKVSNLVPKSYNAKITFAGNNNYLGSDATAKVVVKKATPKITASNKMFKTTTKTKKYAIILKDNTGKPIRNAKVYLKVNGKTYKATTNSKGKATFKITKLSKTGTFKATVTYKGNKYYNKASKKVTVKVISTWKTISKGSKAKSTVKEIQRALKNNGYYLTAYGHYLKVDGIYWDYTVKAVKQFQKAKGLKVTGKVDEKTAKKLGIL